MSCSYGLLFEPCNRVVVLVSRFVVCTIASTFYTRRGKDEVEKRGFPDAAPTKSECNRTTATSGRSTHGHAVKRKLHARIVSETPCALTLVARAINTEYGIGTPILGCHFRHPFLYVLWDVSSDTVSVVWS